VLNYAVTLSRRQDFEAAKTMLQRYFDIVDVLRVTSSGAELDRNQEMIATQKVALKLQARLSSDNSKSIILKPPQSQ
jgi:hypothetical protein